MTALAADISEPSDFFEHLRARDFRFGTGEVLRGTTLILEFAKRTPEARSARDLTNVLAPVLCTTAQDQARFAHIVDEFLDLQAREQSVECREPQAGPLAVKATAEGRPLLRFLRLSKIVPIVAAAIVVAVGVAVALYFIGGPTLGTTGPDVRPTKMPVVGDFFAGRFEPYRFVLLPWIAYILFRRWWKARLSALRREQRSGDAVSTPVGVQDAPRKLFNDVSLRAVFQALRVHLRRPSKEVDASKTVRATAAAAGRLRLHYASRPHLPEYPLLIDQLCASDHVSELGHGLLARLEDERVNAIPYTYRGDPRSLRGPSGQIETLTNLAAQYPGNTLLIVGDGANLIDPNTGAGKMWLSELAEWREAVLLTPVPVERWSMRERKLEEAGLLVLPATPRGLALLARRMQGGREAVRDFVWYPRLQSIIARRGLDEFTWHRDVPVPDEGERAELIDALAVELSHPAFELLCAVALFPQLRLDLTHFIGDGLKRWRRDETGAPVETADPLLNEETFAAIAWLPWLRFGRMPDWLRRDLISCLSERRREELRILALRWLLPGQTAESIRSALQMEAANPGALAALLRGVGGGEKGSVLRDRICFHFLKDGKLDALDLEAPADLQDHLRPTWFSRERFALYAAIAASVGLAFYGESLDALARALDDTSRSIFLLMPSGASLAALLCWLAAALLPARIARYLPYGLLGTVGLVCAIVSPTLAFNRDEMLVLLPAVGGFATWFLNPAERIENGKPQTPFPDSLDAWAIILASCITLTAAVSIWLVSAIATFAIIFLHRRLLPLHQALALSTLCLTVWVPLYVLGFMALGDGPNGLAVQLGIPASALFVVFIAQARAGVLRKPNVLWLGLTSFVTIAVVAPSAQAAGFTAADLWAVPLSPLLLFSGGKLTGESRGRVALLTALLTFALLEIGCGATVYFGLQWLFDMSTVDAGMAARCTQLALVPFVRIPPLGNPLAQQPVARRAADRTAKESAWSAVPWAWLIPIYWLLTFNYPVGNDLSISFVALTLPLTVLLAARWGAAGFPALVLGAAPMLHDFTQFSMRIDVGWACVLVAVFWLVADRSVRTAVLRADSVNVVYALSVLVIVGAETVGSDVSLFRGLEENPLSASHAALFAAFFFLGASQIAARVPLGLWALVCAMSLSFDILTVYADLEMFPAIISVEDAVSALVCLLCGGLWRSAMAAHPAQVLGRKVGIWTDLSILSLAALPILSSMQWPPFAFGLPTGVQWNWLVHSLCLVPAFFVLGFHFGGRGVRLAMSGAATPYVLTFFDIPAPFGLIRFEGHLDTIVTYVTCLPMAIVGASIATHLRKKASGGETSGSEWTFWSDSPARAAA